jgi:sulfonate transport system permease protein
MTTAVGSNTRFVAGSPVVVAGSGVVTGTLEPSTAKRKLSGVAKRRLRRLAPPLILLTIWETGAAAGWFSEKTYSSPFQIAHAFASLLNDGQLERALGASLERVAIGLSLGVVVGSVLGLLSGLFRAGEDVLDPLLQMIRTLPVLALTPLLVLWFGIGELPKDLLIAYGTFFPVYLNVFAGIRGVDNKLVEAGKTLGLSRFRMIREVILPGALPSALIGLRYAAGISWLLLFVAEEINATSGIGLLMQNAQQFFQTQIVFVGIIVYALMGLSADLSVRFIEKRVLTWRTNFTGA